MTEANSHCTCSCSGPFCLSSFFSTSAAWSTKQLLCCTSLSRTRVPSHPFLPGFLIRRGSASPSLACAPMTISRQNIIAQFISCLPYFLHLHLILYWLFALLVLISLSLCLSLSLALLLPGLRGRSKPPGHQGPPAFDGLLEGSEGSTMLGPKWHELGVLLLCCFGLSSCFRTFEFSLALARSRSRSRSLSLSSVMANTMGRRLLWSLQ